MGKGVAEGWRQAFGSGPPLRIALNVRPGGGPPCEIRFCVGAGPCLPVSDPVLMGLYGKNAEW